VVEQFTRPTQQRNFPNLLVVVASMPRRLCEIIDDGERKAMLTLLGYEVCLSPVRLAGEAMAMWRYKQGRRSRAPCLSLARMVIAVPLSGTRAKMDVGNWQSHGSLGT
jgi:hypothetical protein